MQSRRDFIKSISRGSAGILVGAIAPAMTRSGIRTEAAYLERCVFAMGTTVTISAHGESREHILHATSLAFDELYRMDKLLSVFRADSDISRLNGSAGRYEVTIDRATAQVLSESSRFHDMTRGAFDITIESLMEAWGFRNEAESMQVVSAAELKMARAGVGMRHLQVLSGGRAFLENEHVGVDLGGIAVGFTVDRMGAILRREGVSSALINHSGDLLAIGAPPDSDGWPVVVPHPWNVAETLATFMLRDRAASTSTNTRTIRTVGGMRVGHILNPTTGENPEGIESVTVLAPNSIDADALSTGLFVRFNKRGEWRNDAREAIVLRTGGEVERIGGNRHNEGI